MQGGGNGFTFVYVSGEMDTSDDDEKEPSVYVAALYAVLSFVVVIVLILFAFIACSKKYRLNWFEKNLLETADAKELTHRYQQLPNP